MIIDNYIITKKLNLNLDSLKNSCYQMENLIEKNFKQDGLSYTGGKVNPSTILYNKYNIFLYPYDSFYELFQEIKSLFFEHKTIGEQYYIQAWLNIYHKNDFIDWHSHWPKEDKTWHGFFCVDCEPSHTTYLLPNQTEPIDVTSENNLLVISQSAGDQHRTWPWEQDDRDRITIAFDIVPKNKINPEKLLNHWIPL